MAHESSSLPSPSQTIDCITLFQIAEPVNLESNSTTLELRLSHVDPNGSDLEYSAISYVWDDIEYQELVLVDGLPLTIRCNLASLLLQNRNSLLGMMLWADVICIDQYSETHCEEQFRLMAKTFARARTVIAWLGPDLFNCPDFLQPSMYLARPTEEATSCTLSEIEGEPALLFTPGTHRRLAGKGQA